MLFGLGTKAWSAIAASVVMVGAVIAGVAVAQDEGFDPVYAPEWQPGYTFSYDVTGTVDTFVQGVEDYMGDEMPSEFQGEFGPFLVKKEVLNTEDYDHRGQPLYVSAANFPLSNIQSGELLGGLTQDPTFIMAERQSDLAPLGVFWQCIDSCRDGQLKVAADNPLTYLNFPLTEGKRWEQTEKLPIPVPIAELADVTRVHIVGEVGGMETIDLGGELGTTRAVRVDFAYRPVGLQEVLAEYAEMAEDMGMDIERFNIQLGVHEIVHYSPEYEAIVKQQYLITALFDVAVSGEIYGHSFDKEVYAEFQGSIDSVLAGSNRAVTEQLSPLQISQKLGNADLINDARGLGASRATVPYSIILDASRSDVNAAEHESVKFSVATSGERPADHQLEYTIRMLDGPEVASGAAGDGFSFTPDEPGVYGVTVRALDAAGKVVTTSTTRYIEADYSAMLQGMCNLMLTGTYCDSPSIPVSPGAHSAVLEVYSYTGTPALSQEFMAHGPDGMTYARDGRHIELDQADIAQLGFGTWDLTYQNVGGFLTEVDFYVDIDYQAPQVLPVHTPPSSNESGSGGGVLDLMGRMLQTLDAGIGTIESGQVQVDLRPILG